MNFNLWQRLSFKTWVALKILMFCPHSEKQSQFSSFSVHPLLNLQRRRRFNNRLLMSKPHNLRLMKRNEWLYDWGRKDEASDWFMMGRLKWEETDGPYLLAVLHTVLDQHTAQCLSFHPQLTSFIRLSWLPFPVTSPFPFSRLVPYTKYWFI